MRDLTKSKILVVDDSKADVDTLIETLGAEYYVNVAMDGKTALEYVEESLPDLIILDIMIPDMDGLEVCRRLKSDERSRDIPVIFISAMLGADEKMRGFELGGMDFIDKPFEVSEVLARVKTHLRLSELTKRLEQNVAERTRELTETNLRLQHEITDRKKVEAALRRSEKDLKESQRIAHVGSWRLDIETNKVVWTDELYKMYGFDPTLPPPPYTEHMKLFTPESWERLSTALARTRDKGVPYELELATVKENGSNGWMWVRGEAVVDENGKTIGLWGAAQDITERKLAEETIKSQKERFGFILEGTHVGTWEWNVQTGETIFNERWAEIIGYSLEEISPTSIKTWIHFTHPKDLQASNEALERHFSGKTRYYDIECRMKHRAGNWVWVWDRGKVISWTQEGIPLWMYGTHQDITERKLAEESLKQSEHRNRTILRTAMDGFWMFDLQGRFLEVNDSYCQMSGYLERELLSMSISDLEVNEAPEEIAAHMQALVVKGQDRFETQHRRKDGSLFDVEVSVQYLPNEGGRSVAFLRDITNQRQRERIQITLLRLIDFSRSHTVLELLQAFLDEAEVLTDSDIGFFHFVEEDQQTISLQTWSTNTLLNMCNATGDGQHYPISQAGVWVDCIGTRKPVIHNDYASLSHRKGLPTGHVPVIRELVVPVIRGGKVVAILGVGNKKVPYIKEDVATVQQLADLAWETIVRRRAQEALQESELKYRSMMESLPDPVFICSPDYRVEYMNPAMEKRTGYHAVGECCYTTIHGFDSQCPWCGHDRAQQGEAFNYEITSPKDGNTYIVANSPIIKKDGTISTLAIFRDITQTKRDQAEKEKLQSQLVQSQKMEAIGTLTGGISHDFNNLLQAVNGYTQLLLMEKQESDPDYEALKAIKDAGMRASDLVRQLLFFSRKADSKKIPLELQHEVEQAQKMLERTIPKMVAIQVNMGNRLWKVNADPVQMEQMLLNLGTNAADAMPDGGKLLFELENINLDADFAKTHLDAQPGRYVRLTISDTGHGMDKETIGNIFDPFFTTKEFGKGTGLGLASVYGIVKSHGGYITCYSEVGQGTTFKIFFPAIEQPESEKTATVEAQPIPQGTETIFLVDDEKFIRDFAQQALRRFGYKTMTASTGEEAFKLFSDKSNEIDLVVMDLGMPGMGGYRCLLELLQINPQVKVIIASGYSINSQVKQSMEAGAKGYVGKPYQLADLLKTVRAVLDEKV